jgi:hypothetical protein
MLIGQEFRQRHALIEIAVSVDEYGCTERLDGKSQCVVVSTLAERWRHRVAHEAEVHAAGIDRKGKRTPPTVASTKHEVEEAAEEKIGHLDEEMDRAVPGSAAVVA